MNAPMNFNASPYAPPKPGAIYLAETTPFGRAGSWLELDARGGGIINLSSGERLPLAGGRQTPHMFASSPPNVSDVHTPEIIAGYLAAYTNKRFLLDRLVQMQPVDKSEFIYRKFDHATTYLVQDPRASELSSAPQTQFTSDTETAKTEDLRLATFIPWRAANQADFSYQQAASRNLSNKIALWREWFHLRSGGLYMTSTNWASSIIQALAADENWGPPGSEGANSNPVRDLKRATRLSPEMITFFAMNLDQFHWFLAHPTTLDYYASFNPGGNTKGMFTEALAVAGDAQRQEVLEFTVPMVGVILVHNVRATTDPAVAADLFWPNDIVLGFHHSGVIPPNYEVATALNFRLQAPTDGSSPGAMGFPDGVPTGNGWRVRMIPMPWIGSGGDLMVVDLSELQKFTANDVGAYISGIS